MEEKLNKLNTHQARGRFAIYLIIGFLILITYLVINLSNQVSNTEVTTGSDAATFRTQIRQPSNPIMPEASGNPKVAQCGQTCFVQGSGNYPGGTTPCAAGLVCEKFIVAGAGGMSGVCVPADGGNCPLPAAQCGEVCSNGAGGQSMSCPSGTTCTEVSWMGSKLGYMVCMPPAGQQCPRGANAYPVEAGTDQDSPFADPARTDQDSAMTEPVQTDQDSPFYEEAQTDTETVQPLPDQPAGSLLQR